jgi:hypothetical protein
MVGIAIAIPVGARLLDRGDPSALLLGLGAVLLIAGLGFVVAPMSRTVTWPWWSAAPIGVCSGLLTGLFGTGGPPLAIYYQLAGADKRAFRGNLMAIFLLMTMVRVPTYAAAGFITAERIASSALVLPAVVVGAWVGNRLHLRVAESTFRRLVATALAVLGVLLLLR